MRYCQLSIPICKFVPIFWCFLPQIFSEFSEPVMIIWRKGRSSFFYMHKMHRDFAPAFLLMLYNLTSASWLISIHPLSQLDVPYCIPTIGHVPLLLTAASCMWTMLTYLGIECPVQITVYIEIELKSCLLLIL